MSISFYLPFFLLFPLFLSPVLLCFVCRRSLFLAFLVSLSFSILLSSPFVSLYLSVSSPFAFLPLSSLPVPFPLLSPFPLFRPFAASLSLSLPCFFSQSSFCSFILFSFTLLTPHSLFPLFHSFTPCSLSSLTPPPPPPPGQVDRHVERPLPASPVPLGPRQATLTARQESAVLALHAHAPSSSPLSQRIRADTSVRPPSRPQRAPSPPAHCSRTASANPERTQTSAPLPSPPRTRLLNSASVCSSQQGSSTPPRIQ